MISRFILVVAIIGIAWLMVTMWERRPASSRRMATSGLILVTSAACTLCPLAVAAVDGAGVSVSIVDIADAPDSSIRSVPTALVADARGRVIARRSGRSAITAMPQLISLARSVA